MYLTVDDNRTTKLWRQPPVYFPSHNQWSHPDPALISSRTEFPPLLNIGTALGVKPGPKGILEVIIVSREGS